METKVCSKCGKELPISEFYAHKNSKDGYASMCKSCHRENIKQSKQKNKELLKIAERGGKQLKDYTARELMEELHKRGYKGTLEYVEVHRIDISNF